MRTSVASLSKKLISTFFAATLALGLVPTAAFAVDEDSLTPIPEGSEGADPIATSAEEEGRDVLALPSDASSSADGDDAASAPEDVSDKNAEPGHGDSVVLDGSQDDSVATGSTLSDREDGTQDDVTTDDDSQAAVPAAGVINQTMSLEVVAQQESTRSYFLAQTLESTKTVPIVSANLPLDKGTTDEVVEPGTPVEGDGSSEDEDGDDSDESDLGDASDDASAMAPGVSSESTVVGSFTYLGMTFAVEPGGEAVALVAADCSKLPEEFVQKQILMVPDAATPDGADYYSVTRIAANAFSSLTKDSADPDHTGCIELFSDEELLAEAGIDPADVAGFLPQDDAATATEDGQDADASSDDIRTIVSMEGNVATLDDGSTYTFTNPLEGRTGILALGVPASVSNIEDDAFSGADTLQYLVVSEGNSEYASFDGALYSADLANLRLIPEGRVGAVRVASSATSVDPEVFSHCPSVDALVADAESEADQFFWMKSNLNKKRVFICEANNSGLSRLETLALGLYAGLIGLKDKDDTSHGLPNGVNSDDSRLTRGYSFMYTRISLPLECAYSSVRYGAKGVTSGGLVPPYSAGSFFSSGSIAAGSYAIPYGSSTTASCTWGFDQNGFATPLTGSVYPIYIDVGDGQYRRITKFTFQDPSTATGDVIEYSGDYAGTIPAENYQIWLTELEGNVRLLGCSYELGEGGESFDESNASSFIRSVSDEIALPVSVKAAPGYQFTGWTWTASGGSVQSGHLEPEVKTTTLAKMGAEYSSRYIYRFTANFTRGYKTDWVLNNGSAMQTTYTPIDASVITFPSGYSVNVGPVRTGWTFDGWYVGASAAACDYDTKLMVDTAANRAIQYHARYKCNFTWNVNGGTSAAPATATVYSPISGTVPSNATATVMAPAAPTAPAGWEFAGWADTAELRADETLVQPGEVIYNHLLDDEAKAGSPTFYARYKASVTFDTSRGSAESGITGTNMTALPDEMTVYAHAAEAGKPLAGTLFASSIEAVTQSFYKFNGYKVTPSTVVSGTTPGATIWYTYATLPEGTISANDGVGTGDDEAVFTDGMALTIQGASNFTLLWAPIAYRATFDAGKTEYAPAPGTVTGMGMWVADASDTTTVPEGQTSRAWAYTYTYDMGDIALPAPVLPGYTYEFVAGSGNLLGEGAASALENGKFDAKQAARAADPAGTGTSLRTLSFAVTWTKSPYEVQVLGTSFPVGSGHYAFTAAGLPLLSIGFDGANGIVIPELFPASTKTSDQAYFDDDYMVSFDGWTIGRLNGGATVSGTPRSHTIALSDIDSFFAAYGTTLENGSIVVYAMPNFTARSTWKATISLPSDAKSNGTWPGWSSIGNGASRTYSCEDSDQITLPNDGAITRFGYTFSQWKVTARKDGALVTGLPANPYTITAGENGEFRLAKNTIYDLTLEPDWVAATGTVRLDAGADDAVLEGAVDFTIDFGQSMMAAKTATGDAFVIPEPTRANHAFLGYFDATGRQYITSGLASARNWDKEPAIDGSAIVLYARWQSDDLDGDGSMDDPQSKVVATSPDDRFSIASTDWSGKPATANVMAGTYNGMMQWNSAAAYPRAFDTVVVNVSSYTLDANSSAAQIRSDFQENAGPNAGKWILGFTVGSQGSYVPFYDIIYGHAVTLTLNGADLVRDGSPTAPAFTVDPTKVKVVWTDVDPGYGDGGDHSKDPAGRPVQAGDVITNIFDAQSGAFKDSYGNTERIKYVTTTVSDSYTGTTKVETAIPDANPVREGYEFLGWSSVPQAAHRDNDDDFKRGKGVNPAITTCETKTYYAHWAPHTYTVELDGNGGAPASMQASWTFGTRTNQDVSAFGREGYVCVGFFDTPDSSGGTMYLDRAGTAMRAWDKGTEVDPVAGQPDFTLYARWAATTATDSPDPFPGISGVTPVVPTTDDNHGVLVSALDANGNSHTVFDGTYEGVFRFCQPVATEIPAATASVQVQMNYYEPAAGGSEAREAQLAAVQMEFEKYHPTGQEHLLGFRVISTGDFISWADIVGGASIDIDCKGSDLVWDATYERPASFRMNAASADGTHVLEAVYGTTPCVDPNDGETVWPVRGETEVVVVFDALAGRFSANGSGDVRFLAVKSVYGSTVNLPSADSDLPLPNGVSGAVYKPNEGWSFNAWREGVNSGSVEVTAATLVRGLRPITYYAHYTQSTHTVMFHEADRAGATPTGKDVVNADAAEGFYIGDATVVSAGALSATPYDKQPYTTIDYPLPAASTFSRAGYDFLGWFDSGDASAVTTAYYLTARGEALAAEGALPARDVTSTVTGDMDMYALWIARTYDVTWHYNYPAYTVGSGDEAVEHPGTSGEDDIYRTDEGWVYGQSVSATVLEGPVFARYPFVKWAVERDATSDRIDSPTGSVRPGASADTRWFTPQSTAVTPADFTAIPLHYYAVWNTQSAHSYGIYLHAGEGGMYSNSADNTKTIPYKFNFPTYVLPTPDTTETNSNFPTTRNGYTFVCWVEMEQASDGSWTATDRLAETVPSGSTGDKHFMATWTKNPYTVTLTGVEGLLPADYNGELSTPVAWDNSWSHAFDVDTTETWTLPSAAQMNQLNAVQLFPHEGKRFVGWRLNGSEQTVDDGHVFDPRAYLRSFANDKLVKNAVFEAVWTDSVYTIVLNPNTGNKQHDNLVYTLEYGADKKMTLPIPVLHDHTGVFSHWDTAPDSDWNASWVAGKELSVPEIFASFAYDESDVEPSREVTGVMEDGTLIEGETMPNVITLHAIWNGAHHADVPLVVGMAVDPNTGDMVFADNGYLRTTNTDLSSVTIEGVTFEKTTAADGAGGGTDAVFASVLDDAVLTVRAQKEGGDAAGGYLEIPLNATSLAERQFTRSQLAAAGFESFDWQHRLNITYGLDFGLADPEGSDRSALVSKLQAMKLPDFTQTGADGWSEESYPIARVYYTIGLTR